MQDGYPLSKYLVKSIHQELLSFGRVAEKSPGKYKDSIDASGRRPALYAFEPLLKLVRV
jgi:hypothetical protein